MFVFVFSVPKMFTEVLLTKHITENYSDFNATTLVQKKPVPNWPQRLAEKALPFIQHEGGDGERPVKVLVTHGGDDFAFQFIPTRPSVRPSVHSYDNSINCTIFCVHRL